MRDFRQTCGLPGTPAYYAFYNGGRGPDPVVPVGVTGKPEHRIVKCFLESGRWEKEMLPSVVTVDGIGPCSRFRGMECRDS
ncbi:hypothetical protein DSCA_27720 [Desulfosarcina alkanivorans]|jgi:hypothetical protein|uniref:Uncharacterized protein n=1 Tax=Desulfosarcina alkanivorans TaxID=571177 RepID=A0A5K7YGW0_9BACT|nr:hypothetical protein DSCA_27720 [Desulfosarcina alkanivorans]